MATKKEIAICIELVGSAAKRNYARSKVLPSIIVAQACLESGYLTSELAQMANNLFGIKWTAHQTPKKYAYKGCEWAVFNSIEECVIQHGGYYNSKPHYYSALIGEKDLDKALTILDESPYCADEGYKGKLSKLIKQYDLTQFDDVKGVKPMKILIDPGHRNNAQDCGVTQFDEVKGEKQMVIVIDPGHRNNAQDCGAVGNGLKESVLALEISKMLKEELEACGQTCYLTRNSENETISVSARPQKAKQLEANLLISIHINSASSAAEGIEVLYKTQKGLAEKVCKGLVEATGARNRGAKQRTDLGVLNGFDKSILIECGFISNPKEANLMSQKDYKKKLVKGIVKGVAQEFGFSIQQSDATTEDMDLSKAVHKIVVSGVEINEKKLVKGIVKGVAQEFGFSIQQSDATTEDMDLSKAVHKIVVSGVEINEVSWNHMDRMKLEYVPGLLKKLGGLDHLIEEEVISNEELWRSGKYTKENVRSLLIKYANQLG